MVAGRSNSRPGTIVRTLESTSDGQCMDGRVNCRKRPILIVRFPFPLLVLDSLRSCWSWRRSWSCSCCRRSLCSRKKKTFDILSLTSPWSYWIFFWLSKYGSKCALDSLTLFNSLQCCLSVWFVCLFACIRRGTYPIKYHKTHKNKWINANRYYTFN